MQNRCDPHMPTLVPDLVQQGIHSGQGLQRLGAVKGQQLYARPCCCLLELSRQVLLGLRPVAYEG